MNGHFVVKTLLVATYLLDGCAAEQSLRKQPLAQSLTPLAPISTPSLKYAQDNQALRQPAPQVPSTLQDLQHSAGARTQTEDDFFYGCPSGQIWVHDGLGGGDCIDVSSTARLRGTAGFNLGGAASPRIMRPVMSRAPSTLPIFPWPPPTPSERIELQLAQMIPASKKSPPSLFDVGKQIIVALESAGYSEYSFYSSPKGFVIVSRLERIRSNGAPAPEKLRFLAPHDAEPFSLENYIGRLFFAPEGYYRQIVFIVTSTMIVPSGPAPSTAQAADLLAGGADRLPRDSFGKMPFSDDYRVAALIYEYYKGAADKDVRALQPGRIGAKANLMRAGIYARLMHLPN